MIVVSAVGANLRSSPSIAPGNVVALIPFGHKVTIATGGTAGWAKVETTIQGTALSGFIKKTLLGSPSSVEIKTFELTPAGNLPAIDLPEAPNRGLLSRRADDSPIFGAPFTKRDMSSTAAMVRSLGKIVGELKVKTSPRYQPAGGATFCNIFTCDYARLGGVYMAHVFWTPGSIARIMRHEKVALVYDAKRETIDTVNALNANALHDWFLHFSDQFGWRRVFDLRELQAAANAGGIGVISAKNTGGIGHISVVVPETDAHKAKDEAGGKFHPLMCEAGARNKEYYNSGFWWERPKFLSGFWVHD